jgi:phospholipase C
MAPRENGKQRPGIEHVVVLMLENRSFDSMLGRLYRKNPAFDGLDGMEWNPWHRPDGQVERIGVWNDARETPRTASPPDLDPGELFDDFSMQIFGLGGGGRAWTASSTTTCASRHRRSPPMPARSCITSRRSSCRS